MDKRKKTSKKDDSKAQIDLLTDDIKRIHADFANYKRRSEEERITVSRFAKQQVIVDLLPVLDNIERALMHVPKDLHKNEWAQGVSKVAKQLSDKLKAMGITRIKTVGEEFDPHLHEAISAEGDGENEVISDELQAGYELNGEVVRHAIVKVKRS